MIWKPFARTLLTVALVLSWTWSAAGAAISISFTGGEGGSGFDAGRVPASVTGVAGAAPAGNWNNADGKDGTLSNLLNSNGAATAASITWSSPNMWSTGAANGPNPSPDANLMAGYLDTGDINGQHAVASVSGIPFANYHVIAYYLGDVPELTRVSSYRLEGAGPTREFYVTNTNGLVPFTGFASHPYASAAEAQGGEPSNFVAFPGASGSSFTLTAVPRDFRAPLSGIQIIETSDVAGDADGNGVLDLADFDVLRNHFLDTVSAGSDGDLDVNAVVDFKDFRIWKNAFAGGAPGSVPEPSAFILLIVGGAGLALARRSRARG